MSILLSALDRTKSTPTKLNSTNATDVYHNNANDKQARKAIGGTACNTDSSARTLTLKWSKADAGVEYAILSAYSIAANTTLDLEPYLKGLRLAGLKEGTGDKLIATASLENTLEIIITVAEPGGAINRERAGSGE